MKTLDVLAEVLAGKRMSKSSKENCKAVFKSLSRIYADFPGRPVDINKWLVGLEGYADQTIRLWFTILRSASEFMENNYNLTNPCKGVEVPKVKKKRRRYFKADEIVRILQACKGDYEVALIMTLVDSGCRVGGLEKLRGGDVGEGYIEVKEKTGERKYRLDSRICKVLKKMAGEDDGLVFGVSSNALSMKVIRICRRAGMKGEKLGPHTFRHSSASLVASETKNAMAVKALLQHDNIQTSMVYIHDVEEDIQKNISPLQLVADKVKESGLCKQKVLTMEGTKDGSEVLVNENEAVDVLIEEMFPVVTKGIRVRPLLKSEDLILIRKGFIELVSNNRYGVDVGRARELMRRILRKVNNS